MDKAYINPISEEFVQQVFDRPIIIYGLGDGAIYRYLDLVRNKGEVLGFTASSIQTETDALFCGLPLYTIDQISCMQSKCNIVIATKNIKYVEEIMDALLAKGVQSNIFGYVSKARSEYPLHRFNGPNIEPDTNKIDILMKKLADDESKLVLETILKYRYTNENVCVNKILCTSDEYYPEMLMLGEQEIYVDGGTYYGDTIEKFAIKANKMYRKIIGFEADPVNYAVAKQYLAGKEIEGCCMENAALYSYDGHISFSNTHACGAKVVADGSDHVKCFSLDSYLDGQEVTYIKLDIEGSEQEALKGAEFTIQTYHPKLAICAYHHSADLWEIPYRIMQEIGGYKVYLRQYGSDLRVDTVCYAIPE